MKVYIDNRGNERALPLELFLDDELYDKLYIRKNVVTVIEFPTPKREVRFSFSGAYSEAERVSRTILDEKSAKFLGEIVSVECSINERKFVCPYDTVIKRENLRNEEIVLQADIFDFSEIKGALYYKAFSLENRQAIVVTLKKRENIGSNKKRPQEITKNLLLVAFALLLIIMSRENFGIDNPRMHYALICITDGLILLWVGLMSLADAIKYKGTYKETELRQEYIIEECGKLSAICDSMEEKSIEISNHKKSHLTEKEFKLNKVFYGCIPFFLLVGIFGMKAGLIMIPRELCAFESYVEILFCLVVIIISTILTIAAINMLIFSIRYKGVGLRLTKEGIDSMFLFKFVYPFCLAVPIRFIPWEAVSTLTYNSNGNIQANVKVELIEASRITKYLLNLFGCRFVFTCVRPKVLESDIMEFRGNW